MAAELTEIDHFLNDNMCLIYRVIHKYCPKGTKDFDELTQDGRITLWEAKLRHDPSKGKFTTIAYRRLQWMMLAYFRRKARLDRLKLKEVDTIFSIEDEFTEHLPDSLTSEERCVVVDLSHGKTRKEIYRSMGLNQKQLKRIIGSAVEKILEANNA